MHKRVGPKLPYQAVVIRQSAMHREGRNAIVRRGGVDPHMGLGPVSVFVFFRCIDSQTGKYGRQQITDSTGASTTICVLL